MDNWVVAVLAVRIYVLQNEIKLNEWGFRPTLCTNRLNSARSPFCNECDDTALQKQDSSPVGLRPNELPLGQGGSPQY